MLERTLLYAGLDKGEFNALKEDAHIETRRSLGVYSMFAAFLFILMAAFEWVTNGFFADNVGYYLAMAAVNALAWLAARRLLPARPNLVLPTGYLCVATLYAFALRLTMLHRDLPAVTFIAILVLTPFLFTDRPVYIVLLNVAATAALCVLSLLFKPQDIALGDEWNGITLCIVSIAMAVFQRKLRFRALAQARHIQYLGQTDLLTGARNRNTFEQAFPTYSDRCRQTLGCVYVDVNGLHAVNDHQGHRAGDVMLQTVAKALLERFGGEHVYRIGGDEFVAFAADVPEDGLRWDMEHIGNGLAAQGYDISVGVACGQRDAMDLQKMLTDAEREMYAQKELYYRQPGHERRGR